MDGPLGRSLIADEPRNPFRNEADAFRILAMVLVAALAVIGLTLLFDATVGALAGVVLVGIGAWRASAWLRYWLGTHSDS